jgi:ornithine cyclodeaminase/alanine dehydrogenase-like protein (mu-crystallin family)
LHLDNVEITAATPDEIIAESDILCTCTSVEIAEGPVFGDFGTKKHLHINAVGSDFPGKTEIPRSMLARSLVCPDFQAQAIAEGECQQLREDEIGPNLSQLVVRPEKFDVYRDKSTVFDSTGWALEDHVASEMLIDHADRLDVGEQVELESISADPKDPYGFAMVGSFDEDIHLVSQKLAAQID